MLQIEARWLVYGLMSVAIASVHVWFPWFERRFKNQENQWLGFVGGVAIGYVALYLLPKLAAMTMLSIDNNPNAHSLIHNRAFGVLLAGLVVYMIIDRLDHARTSLRNTLGAFLEYGVHGLYSFLAGYLQIELPRPNLTVHVLATVILLLHLMGMSHFLQQQRPEGYPAARWFLFGCVLAGIGLALVTELPLPVLNASTAFLCGVIIVNVVAGELPMGNKNRFGWFLIGVLVFVALELVIGNRAYAS